MKIDTIRYVFENKQPELRRLIVKYGLTPAKDKKDLWTKTNYLVAQFKNEMLKDIVAIHPDKDLIIWAESSKVSDTSTTTPTTISEKVNTAEVVEKKSGACGCSGADGDDYSYCGGNPNCNCGNANKNDKTSSADGKSFGDTLKDNMPLVVIGSLIVVGGLLFLGGRKAI